MRNVGGNIAHSIYHYDNSYYLFAAGIFELTAGQALVGHAVLGSEGERARFLWFGR